MVDITAWMELFLQALNDTFAQRVWFVGLQGSYARGEATQSSDIDVVVILDELSPKDLNTYHTMLDALPHRELVCGFISGKREILNWEQSDLLSFYYDTKPIQGSLDALVPLLDEQAVDRAIKIGACNIYHGCVHNMLYDKSGEILKALYKTASFVVQAICFKQTGEYIGRQKELLNCAPVTEQCILRTFMHLKHGGDIQFEAMSEQLFCWAKEWVSGNREIRLMPVGFQHSDWFDGASYGEMPPKDRQRMIDESVAKAHDGKYFELFAVMEREACVGFVSLYEHTKTEISCAPEIKPQYRKQGLACGAMTQAMAYAKSIGFTKAVAQVRKNNLASIALHEKLGFVPCKAYVNAKGHPVLWLEKAL